jgi:hypothetical protein
MDTSELEELTREELPTYAANVNPGLTIETIDPTKYESKATPKLKVVIIAKTGEQLNDAKVIKHLLRRDRIRSSIYNISDVPTEDTITATEDMLAESIKNCCCVLSLVAEEHKHIAIRAWLAGRWCATWQVATDPTPYRLAVERVSSIPYYIRKIKSEYTKEMIADIKRQAFTHAEFK